MQVDLNLVRLFVAVYETRGVSAAAQRLNLTQPTVSYGLSKLRDLLQDPLFVRTRYTMEPTPRADIVYSEFVTSLRAINRVVDLARTFDPATTQRRFVLSMSDIGEMIFLPPILTELQKRAPHAELEIQQVALSDLPRRLGTGEITAAIGNLSGLEGSHQSAKLFTERYVCLAHRSNPIFDAPLTKEKFEMARHVNVTSTATGHSIIEQGLQSLGIKRNIALEIGHFAILSHVVGLSDLVALVPSRVAKLFEQYEDLGSCELPVPLPLFDVCLHWHDNDRSNVAGRWMRSLVQEVLSDLPQ